MSEPEDPMEPEKPLYVLVAEALGWFRIEPAKGGILLPDSIHPCLWKGAPPNATIIGAEKECIPRYDLDWSVTGPLVQRFSFSLSRTSKAVTPPLPGDNWIAMTPEWHPRQVPAKTYADGRTALEAICALIVKLGGTNGR